MPSSISAVEAESAAASLAKALARCEDSYLAARVKYRIGVLYFRAHMLEAASTRFREVANDSNAPELVRACSFNMVGQTARMLGRDSETLEAFSRVAHFAEEKLSGQDRNSDSRALKQLWCAAVFSRAEVFETRREYAACIAEYDRLMQFVKRQKDGHLLDFCGPLANERLGQSHLRTGDVKAYLNAVEKLAADYPQYYRTPVARFEAECVKFLTNVSADSKFINGSFNAPAQALAYLKSPKADTSAPEVAGMLAMLGQEYQSTYGQIVLQYHYAWFLDALGQKDKAVDMLAGVVSAEVVDTNDNPSRNLVLETIQEYAKIQSAIMLGERADYKEALRMLDSLQAHPQDSHLSELAESVAEGIQTLKREVLENES
jgi:predicted negative regulator of RcsB-dependent stress response